MGMFDYINYECACPNCKNKVVGGFQSKDGDCSLDTLSPSQVCNFYSTCGACGCWIEFQSKPSTNFVRTVQKKNKLIDKLTKNVRING